MTIQFSYYVYLHMLNSVPLYYFDFMSVFYISFVHWLQVTKHNLVHYTVYLSGQELKELCNNMKFVPRKVCPKHWNIKLESGCQNME